MRSMPERGIHYVMANGDGYVKMKRTGYQSPLSCMANRKWVSSPLDHDGIGDGGHCPVIRAGEYLDKQEAAAFRPVLGRRVPSRLTRRWRVVGCRD